MLINHYSISEYDSGRWVLNVNDRNFLVNDNTVRLLQTLKDANSIEDAHGKFQQLFMADISLPGFQQMIEAKLGGYGLLTGSNARKRKPHIQFLKFKFQILNAAWAGYFATPFVRLFQPKVFLSTFLLFSLFLISIYAIYPPFNWADFIGADLVLFLCLALPHIIIHEVGHIAACKRFSIKHGGIGTAVYWIFPVCYADIGNLWTVGRTKRIIANLGGIYLQLLYATVLSIAFLFTHNITLLYVSFFVTATALVQFNPFVRFDGYWILSDITDTPNLLHKANRLIKVFGTKKFLYNLITHPIKKIRNTKRSSLVVFTYGMFNYAFMITFLAWCIYQYHEQIIRFPYTLYNLITTDTYQWDINIMDWKGEYMFVLIFYLLLFSMVKKVVQKKVIPFFGNTGNRKDKTINLQEGRT